MAAAGALLCEQEPVATHTWEFLKSGADTIQLRFAAPLTTAQVDALTNNWNPYRCACRSHHTHPGSALGLQRSCEARGNTLGVTGSITRPLPYMACRPKVFIGGKGSELTWHAQSAVTT